MLDARCGAQWTRTAGDIRIDSCFFGEMDKFDNLFFYAIPGATNFLLGDSFTFANSLSGSDGINQHLIKLLFNQYMRHNGAGAETTSDP